MLRFLYAMNRKLLWSNFSFYMSHTSDTFQFGHLSCTGHLHVAVDTLGRGALGL